MLITASQLNRTAVEEIEFDHSHIAGGLSKVQTADNVIGIFTSAPMRERGRYQIQFMKTRSSSGVGQRVDLGFNLQSLRIEDLSEDEMEEDDTSAPVYKNILRTSQVQDDKEVNGKTTNLSLEEIKNKLLNKRNLN